jgi:TorA maturation chaperone TorD
VVRSGVVEIISRLAPLRHAAYRLFAALFLYPDDDRLAGVLETSGVLRRYDASTARLAFFPPWQRLLITMEHLSLDGAAKVREEHMRLFLVNPVVPPYESLYTPAQADGGGIVAARLTREYADSGLALAPSLAEPPDAVAVELEFMAFLTEQEARAWSHGSLDEAVQVLAHEQRFLVQHLDRWFPALARRVRTAAPEGFYATVAEATDAFVRHDRDLVDLVLMTVRMAESLDGRRTAGAAG